VVRSISSGAPNVNQGIEQACRERPGGGAGQFALGRLVRQPGERRRAEVLGIAARIRL
jgi:hypothetical protein